jgi:predicted negative regulator of RcsB-dependent stress response
MYATSYFERRQLMMKRLLIVVAVALIALVAFIGFNLLTPRTAQAQTTDDCVHIPTIASLEACVEHAAQQGFIDNQGITNSLLAKLDAAQAALDHGQTSVAINKLQAFVHEVQAQTGKHIVQEHAQHLVMHARLVIQALKNG